MKKEFWLIIILAIILIVLAAVLAWPINKAKAPVQKPTENTQNNQPPQQIEGIQVVSPKAGDAISSPVKITGTTNGGGWSGFEGQVGTVQLLDYKGNKLATAVLKATTEWTKPEVSFEATLNFDNKTPGPATLLFKNENPSGSPDKDKLFGLSVVIK